MAVIAVPTGDPAWTVGASTSFGVTQSTSPSVLFPHDQTVMSSVWPGSGSRATLCSPPDARAITVAVAGGHGLLELSWVIAVGAPSGPLGAPLPSCP